MSYTLEYDSAYWYPVPSDFPVENWRSPHDWLAEFVAQFQNDLGDIPDDGVAALREFGSNVLAERPGDVSESLIFCPRSVPVVGLVNVLVTDQGEDSETDLSQIVADDDRALLPPTIEDIMTDRLGAGKRAATVVPSAHGEIAGGAFTYAFRTAGQLVVVGASADTVADATTMLPFLDELIRGISVDPE